MGRAPCCAKEGLRKGPWSAKEDLLLTSYIKEHGEGQWRSLPKEAGLLRCGKSCRLRWMNYLRPGIKRGNFSQDEEDLILRLHSLLGNRWSIIAGRLPGRTDNEIKNYWNTHLIKKLKSAGIEPKVNKNFSKYCSKKEPKKKIEKPRKKEGKKKSNKKKDQPLVQGTADPPQVVFIPKPIRISSGLSRNNSVDQDIALSTSSSNNSQEADNNNNNNNIISNNDMNEVSFIRCASLFDEVLLDGGCELSPEWSLPTDDTMLDKVYEEYLQLISEKCYLQLDDPLAGNVSDHPMLM